MRLTGKIAVVAALACVVTMAGCTKKVRITVYNHSDSPVAIKVTVPDGTVPMGSVGPNGGRLSHVVKVKHEDFPAQCTCSAGLGNSQYFTVDEDSHEKIWFHVTGKGRLVGPYEKPDRHVEDEVTKDVKIKVREGTVVVP